MRARDAAGTIARAIVWLMFTLTSSVFAADERSNALVQGLQKGGYVIFIRHAGTNGDHKDTDIRDLTNCTTQRNLTAHGRDQSKLIGQGFAVLKIPVGDVFTSEYCRCSDTAQIAFGRATRITALSSHTPLPPDEKQQRIEALRGLLNISPDPGTNTVIVSHHDMFQDASGLKLVEGEAAIFQPSAAAGTRFVARIRAEGWPMVVGQYLSETRK